jgi:toxin CptA
VNRACVFGAIAKWSNGDWAYAATPIGFFLGCALFWRVLQGMGAPVLSEAAPALAWPAVLVWASALLLLWRAAWGVASVWRRHALKGAASAGRPARGAWHAMTQALWQPGPATVVIGLSFLAMMLLAGPWAYTEVLNDWALGMPRQTWPRALLACALFGGAALGGWRAGKWARSRLRLGDIGRCTAGGMLMGCGSLLIPGGNDGLILVGMPLLWPYAWMAFGTMCLTISALMACQKLTQ